VVVIAVVVAAASRLLVGNERESLRGEVLEAGVAAEEGGLHRRVLVDGGRLAVGVERVLALRGEGFDLSVPLLLVRVVLS
jgi:hypothetical protein